MSSPTDRNRLDEEASAYLLQHADNPVNWQPWDESALEAAREREVPIFLSIGYSACHWCHVMEEESFVDDAVAEALNDEYVPIKVDREERPDLDRVYQTACQLVSGRGGWPLSVWLTPDGKPFHVGTYFPRESRQGMPGFLDVLESVADSWNDPEEREELLQRADQLTSRVQAQLESVPESADEAADDAAATILGAPGGGSTAAGGDAGDAADESGESAGIPADATADAAPEVPPGPADRTAAAAVRRADREHGGWGSGPKFPQPVRVDALFDAAETADEPEYEAVAVATLAAMVDGGLYDHVGGGFHRYCTDREWVVPHFEKMLYDNAELPRVLLAGYQVTGRERFATVAEETFAFLDRELAQPDGAFASTLDARSAVPPERTDDREPGEQEEGAFYVWTPSEVEDALAEVDVEEASVESSDVSDGAALADLVCERYGITEAGNFEGKTVLTVDASLQELAEDRDLTPAAVRELLDLARSELRRAREERPRPRRDEKVIGAWNGLAIRALAEGAIVLDDDGYAERAREALDAVRDRLWDGETLARRYVLEADADGDAGDAGADDSDGSDIAADVQGSGYLEDYAFLGRGALACYEATADVEPLGFALDLADAMLEQFYDDAAGTLYFTPAAGESLIARPQEPRDQSTPSSLAAGADLLAALDAFVPHDRYGDAAESVLRTHAETVERQPLEHPSLALAAERFRSGSTEVTIAADERADEWRSWLAETYLPRRLLAPRPATADGLDAWLDELELSSAPPIWAGREADDGPTAYVCRGFTCSRPLRDPADATTWLDG